MSSERAERTLEHLVRLAAADKAYSWWAAGHYQRLDPHELGDMRDRLVERMTVKTTEPIPK